MKRFSLFGKMPAKRLGENAPRGRLLRRGDDAYRSTPAVAQHPSEFGEASRRVGKKHQAELGHDGIEAGVLER